VHAAARARVRTTAGNAAEIAPEVFCLGPWGRTQTNVYLVRSGDEWLLVDAGWQRDAARISDAVARVLGRRIVPAAILLSHVHPAHSGAARILAEAWRCPVFVHPGEVAIASGDLAAMRRDAGPLDRWLVLPAMRVIGESRRAAVLARGSLAAVIRQLEPDGSIPGGQAWTWLATPGHTRGHIAFVRATDRLVLTGDALVTMRVNAAAGFLRGAQGLSGPPWYTTWDRRMAAASIGAIAALEPTVIGGGHGLPVTGPGTADAVRAFAAEVASRGRS
jgi:glyoxylase-like metal-dependent hydrolase (beta-lactamase superfamily II)